MSNKAKFCKDCKHCVKPTFAAPFLHVPLCRANISIRVNEVYGEKFIMTCREARRLDEHCGSKGLKYKPSLIKRFKELFRIKFGGCNDRRN